MSLMKHKKPFTTQGDRKSFINRDDTPVVTFVTEEIRPGLKTWLIFIIKATKRIPMIQNYNTETLTYLLLF